MWPLKYIYFLYLDCSKLNCKIVYVSISIHTDIINATIKPYA